MEGAVVFWIIAAVILGLVEALTFNLVSIWFAIGAIITAITAVFVDSPLVLWSVFVLSSLLLFVLTKPFVKRFFPRKEVATNADRIIGQKAMVTEDIDAVSGAGRIDVIGQSWAVKSSVNIPKGEYVAVTKIEGVKAIVEKIEAREECLK